MRHTIASLILLLTVSSALAVGTSHWTHTTEADFKAGTFENVVATNLGDLKLSRATRTLVHHDARISAVYALAETPDGSIYAATGPQGVLLKVNDDAVETAATLGDNLNLFALAVDAKGRLLIGTGGAKGAIYRIERSGDKPVEIFSDPDAQYIWAIAATSDGKIYAATGPNGKLYEIDGAANDQAASKVLFDSDENNLLSLASDGKELLYVGSDPNGHIYRVNRKSGESFVVFDAPESEVTALAIDGHGNLYAGTGQSSGEGMSEPAPPTAEKSGRPEQDQAPAVPIPSDPPASPKPPELPLPSPGEPPAIPKTAPGAEPKRLMIAADPQQESPIDPTDPTPPTINAAQQAQQRQASPPPITPNRSGEPPASGNAVYRIDGDGFVTEIFRQNVLVFSIHENNGVLLVGTGSEGMVYQINPTAEETSVVAKVDPKEVMCLLPSKAGRIYMGMANDGAIITLSSGFAEKGTFTSPVLDAEQMSRFGKLHLRGKLPEETSLTIATRSSNVGEATDAGWSKWSDEAPATAFMPVTSPSARFLQYRLTFKSATAKTSPIVDEVSVAYQMPNLAPQIKGITLSTSAAQQQAPPAIANPAVTMSWETFDANGDLLQFTLYFRRLDAAAGDWVLLKEKLTDLSFEWNTRSVGDGRYEVKIVATDAMVNPMGEGRSASRVSDPIEIDNTAPDIGDITSSVQEGAAKVNFRVADRISTVARLEYAVDSSADWQALLPVDKIADSPDERYELTVGGLNAGSHQVTLRATDSHGNQSFQTVTVTIEK